MPTSQSSSLDTDLSLALATSWPTLDQYVPRRIFEQVSVPQAMFLLSDDRELFYGGAVGGGKSAALLMGALQYVDVATYRALILRRTFAQLSKGAALIPLSQEWLAGTDAVWNEQKRRWTFPSGATIEFGHVETEQAKYDYQGAAFQYVGFDELTHFTESIYDYIAFSRQRRTADLAAQGVPIRVRATGNPGGVGHGWVKRRFIDTGQLGQVFIPAKVADNPGWVPGEYEESLEHLPEALRKQLLDGDWGAFEGAAFTITDAHMVAAFPIPQVFERFESMDYGLNNPTAWLAWCVDYDGNVIVHDSFYRPGLPSETSMVIRKLRQSWRSSECWGDPNSLAMRTGTLNRLGQPATIETEFADNGVPIAKANDNPRAGYTRLRELLQVDARRRFPDWHPLRGEYGSPRMFVVERKCPELAEQLRSAPLQPVDKRDAGEMIDPEWEGLHGHAVAAARYGGLTRPSPSVRQDQPPDDPRAALLWEVERKRRQPSSRQSSYEW